ncbi:ankyrin repeat domain-containing protein 10 [Platysternon megacephalum]|uniref:Ankyrin repeat domain-containing protein 10 n=1 Tax=Platysternon megacephalum TaxID=55544 RepID=A0A4D9EGW7_9SAUR|nr:ankyrin repeat domain-containing protein 10 [Platysternon megacephalum]
MAQSCKHDAIHSTVKVYILYILYKCKNHMENIQQHNLAEVSSTRPKGQILPHPHPSQKAILSGMQNVRLPQFCQVYDYWQSMPCFCILVLLSLVVLLYPSISWQDEMYVHLNCSSADTQN